MEEINLRANYSKEDEVVVARRKTSEDDLVKLRLEL